MRSTNCRLKCATCATMVSRAVVGYLLHRSPTAQTSWSGRPVAAWVDGLCPGERKPHAVRISNLDQGAASLHEEYEERFHPYSRRSLNPQCVY